MTADDKVAGYWVKIEAVLRREVPEVAARLNLPATAERIESLERRLGVKLPDDFVASVRIHDGIARLPDRLPCSRQRDGR